MKTSKEVDKALKTGEDIATKYGHAYVSTEHMLLSILANKEFQKLLHEYGAQIDELSTDLESHIATAYNKTTSHKGSPIKTQALERVFNRALTSVLFSGREEVTLLDIFISIMSENNTHSSYFLMKYSINKDEVIQHIKKHNTNGVLNKQQAQYLEGVINDFCEDLTEQAKNNKLDPVIGRDDIIDDITQTFASVATTRTTT